VGNEWAMSINTPGIEYKNHRPKGYLKYDILVSLKYKLKHLF
jgi:hypothetical protein